MRQRLTSTFREERARFALRFTCEDCSHFQVERERCAHGYPNEVHRGARYEQASEQLDLVFCKDFDLV